MKKCVLSCCVVMLFFAGCTTAEQKFGLISTIDNPVATASRGGNRVRGEVCHNAYLLIIGSGGQKIDDKGAVREAIRKAKQLGYSANALANVEITTHFTNAILFSSLCTIAEGNPVNIQVY